MRFKKFQWIILLYNLKHYGTRSTIFFNAALNRDVNASVNVLEILKLSYKQYGIKKTILTNISLFLGIATLLALCDVMFFYIGKSFLTLIINIVLFILLLRKFDVYPNNKYQILLFFYLTISFLFNYSWLLSFFFIVIYENMITITRLKGGL